MTVETVTKLEQREKIIKKTKKWLNERLGNDVDNLMLVNEIYEDWSKKKNQLERSLASVSSEVPSKVSDAARNVDDACIFINKTLAEIDGMLEKIKNQTVCSEKLYWNLKEYFDKINELDRFLSYLKVLKTAQEASNSLKSNLSTQDVDKSIFEYNLLCNTSLSLMDSKCTHLKDFLFQTTKYWNGILKEIISNEFTNIMKSVNWPIVGTNLASSPSTDALTRFQNCVGHLLKIQLPAELKDKPVVSSSLQVSFPSLTLPIIQLLIPLRKRFLYHFTGSRQTNRIDKPEWYFTQILSWIRDHENFLQTWVQPIYNDLNVDKVVVVEFMCGLVQMSVEKLQCDLEEVQYDDTLFSHTVDEALGYERELRQVHSYPLSLPGPLHVLTQAQLFVKWIRMEKKFAREKMDAMLISDSAWYTLSGLDDEKTTEVAHTFLALISTMTDRYSLLPQPGHRLQFVELELELIDDLRVSLLQILHLERADPINSKVPAILNTVHHLKTALEQYDVSPTVLLLQHYKSQYSTNENDGGIFHETITLLERLQVQLLEELSAAVLMEVKARSRPYRKFRWFSLTDDDFDGTSVTQEACPMFQALADNLHKLHESLSEKMFGSLWRMVSSQLNNFLYEELILNNTFSITGGRVLEKDIMKFLIPLFQQYTSAPIPYFFPIKEACNLLSLPSLPIAVKKAVLTENLHEMKFGLSEKIKHLNLEQAAAVLSHRIDVAPSLI
ncbi:unnamed protein product [Nezara viridula]|uniref:RAD50-interacting protein 1 n=1 Tax=Nezara viridula TaxID=85310 RepID=A0A9P0E4T1_NEZVI|nr:unnamed protein product [Nezara viridula]